MSEMPEEFYLRTDGSYSAHAARSFKHLMRGYEEALFGMRGPRKLRLPWEPVPGKKCPFCHGIGHDDGGPGSWSCYECDRTGTLPLDWRVYSHLQRIPSGTHLPLEWEVLSMDDLEREKWRACVDYYRGLAISYRKTMHWEAPEVDYNSPPLPDGTYLDRPADGPYAGRV